MLAKLIFQKSFALLLCILFFSINSNAQALEEISNPDYYWPFHYIGGDSGNTYYFYHNYEYDEPIYHYDGTELKYVPLPSDNYIRDYEVNFNGLDYFLSITLAGIVEFYSYDGNIVTNIPPPGGYSFRSLETVYNEKMVFSLYGPLGNLRLANFNGTSFNFIPNPADYYFKADLSIWNDILYLTYEDVNQEGALFSYDGSSLTQITTPTFLGYPSIVHKTGNELYVGLFNQEINTLYIFDGIEFTEIPNPAERTFINIVGADQNGLYLDYTDEYYSEGLQYLYLLEGTTLTELPLPSWTWGIGTTYYGTHENIPYFSIYDEYENEELLHYYDGSTFLPVPGPLGYQTHIPLTTYNDKIYIFCHDASYVNKLAILDPSMNEVSFVNNPDGASSLRMYEATFNDFLLLSYFVNNEAVLYLYDGENFTPIPNPDNYTFQSYYVEDNNTAYLRYRLNTSYYDEGSLFKLTIPDSIPSSDGISLAQIDLNESVNIYPSPASTEITLSFNNVTSIRQHDIEIYNSNGTLLSSEKFKTDGKNSQHTINIEHFSVGNYYIIGKTDKGTFTKHLVKI